MLKAVHGLHCILNPTKALKQILVCSILQSSLGAGRKMGTRRVMLLGSSVKVTWGQRRTDIC